MLSMLSFLLFSFKYLQQDCVGTVHLLCIYKNKRPLFEVNCCAVWSKNNNPVNMDENQRSPWNNIFQLWAFWRLERQV
jgi:hypothetical protein